MSDRPLGGGTAFSYMNAGRARSAAIRHDVSIPIQGDPARALEFALTVLTASGFRMTSRTADAVELRGPGMHSSRQSPLRGASAVRVSAADGRLSLGAELGGVEWMRRFLILFPLGICLFLGAGLSFAFWMALGPGKWIYIVVTVVAAYGILWNSLGPFIARRIENRTRDELDTLAANAALMSAPVTEVSQPPRLRRD